MTPLRRRLRRLRRTLGYGSALLVILAGLVVATVSQLLPLLERHPQQVAAWLSERSGQPVELSAVQARWTRRGPLFDLEGLRIGTGERRLDIGRAALQLDVYAGLLPQAPLVSLRLHGLSLTLQRDAEGRWQLQGLGGAAGDAPSGGLERLQGLGELVMDGARVQVHDLASDRTWSLERVDARLRSGGGRQRFAVAAYGGGVAPLRITGELAGGSGRLHLSGHRLELGSWLQGLEPEGLRVDAGQASFQLWLQLEQRRPVRATLALAEASLALQAPDGDADAVLLTPLRGQWVRRAEGWTLGLDVQGGGWLRARSERGVVRAGAQDWPFGDLFAVLAESDRVPPALHGWLRGARPGGRIEAAQAIWRAGQLEDLYARLVELHAAPVGEVPGFEGVALALRADAQSARLELQAVDTVLHWPPALAEPLAAEVSGPLALYRDEDAYWHLEAERVDVRGGDFAFAVAGGLRFDGGRPSADLQIEVAPGPIVAAKRLWIRHKMPPQAVAWLDRGLLDGRLLRGQLLLSGDLDDWPFETGQGRLLAEAEVADVVLDYHEQWPRGEALAGWVEFLNRELRGEVSAQVLGNRIDRASARIVSLRDPVLELAIEGEGSGPGLLQVVRQSALQETFGAQLEPLTVGGRATVALDLMLPLRRDLGEIQVAGHARLHAADLGHATWALEFAEASGDVRFSQHGFAAQGLQTRFADQPARLDLALGSFTSDPTLTFEASLGGRFEVASLLDFRPELDWLEPHLRGSSVWSVRLQVPERGGGPSLQLASDLVGTTLALPAPLSKAAAVRMPLALRIDVPPEDRPRDAATLGGTAIDLRLGALMRLYGHLAEAGGIDGVAVFGEVAGVERPPRGLRVVGQVPAMDASGWTGLATSTTGGAGVVDLDLFAGVLDVLDRSFAETRIQLRRPPAGGLRIELDGPALAGEIVIPEDAVLPALGVTARFERLHWPAPRGGDAAMPRADPRELPPLHLWARDFRMGAASLGETRLETFPQPLGMRIDLLESRSQALQLFGRGDWRRDADGERSEFDLEFTAQDLGGMLRALGFAELIEGGQTLATLHARWPGAPAAFALEQLDGALEIEVGPGRAPAVEPGAGRFLGLFSLREIPRRLALDFSDIFRAGLGFNRIAGGFRLEDGNAFTDDLVIESPAAEIRIRGRTGLKDQDYAQTMEVLPRTSSVLPVVGALAGGPAGAALGAVAQAMLQQPFRQINRTLYRVEGPWAQPVLEVLERGPARPEAADPASPQR